MNLDKDRERLGITPSSEDINRITASPGDLSRGKVDVPRVYIASDPAIESLTERVRLLEKKVEELENKINRL